MEEENIKYDKDTKIRFKIFYIHNFFVTKTQKVYYKNVKLLLQMN